MPTSSSSSPTVSPPMQHTSASRARSYMSSRARSRTPSQSRSPSRSTPLKRSYSRRASSRHSFTSEASSGRSRSRSPPSLRGGPSQREKNHNKGKLIKDSAGLLLGIGVAAVVAHKFWPKGMLYGDKEDWEKKVEKKVERVKDKVKEKVLGGEGDDAGAERNRDDENYYTPPLRERGTRAQRRDGRYRNPERALEPPIVRSHSLRAGDCGMRGLTPDHAQTRVHERIEMARGERPSRDKLTEERMSSWEFPPGRYHSYPRGEQSVYRDDQIVVVEEHGPRRGRRVYR